MDAIMLGTVIAVVGVILGLILFGARKKDAALYAGGSIVVIGVLFAVFGGITVPSLAVTPSVPAAVAGEAKTLNQLTVKLQEAESLSWTAADGTLKIYTKETDLSRDSDKTLSTLTITDGNGQGTLSGINVFQDYKGGIDGAGTYYDQDWGVFYFKGVSTTTSTVDVTVRIPSGEGLSKSINTGLTAVATFQDVFNEAKHDATYGDTNYSLNDVNELRYTRITDTIDINKTATGTNGQVKLRIELGCNGANQVCKNFTFGFDKNSDALIEGDEISSFTAQLYTGTDLKVTTDLLQAWKNNQGFVLGDVKGGTLGTYDLTIGLNTANITAGADSFKMCVDDIGTANNPVDQKDLFLGSKATKDCTTINLTQ